MSNGLGSIARVFGSSHNDRYADLMCQLADIAVECAAHFRQTQGQDVPGIVAFERKADKVVDEIHELLDNSFIMRFDIPDATKLTDEVDDVIDGMRRAATHIEIYKPVLGPLRKDAIELMVAGERAIQALRDQIALLKKSKLNLQEARDKARVINDAESEADTIIAAAERGLVVEFTPPTANRLQFIALDKLYGFLEEMTDDCKRCGKLIVSLARKES